MLDEKNNDIHEGEGEEIQESSPGTPENPDNILTENKIENPGDGAEAEENREVKAEAEVPQENEETSGPEIAENPVDIISESKDEDPESEAAESNESLAGADVQDRAQEQEGTTGIETKEKPVSIAADRKPEDRGKEAEAGVPDRGQAVEEAPVSEAAEPPSVIPAENKAEDPETEAETGASDHEEGEKETTEPETTEHSADTVTESRAEAPEDETSEDDEAQAEIDASNAEEAEDEDNTRRHTIPMPDYHAMSMEALANELKKLVDNEKVQAIRKHVEEIKQEFNAKYHEFLEQKKEDFMSEGGNEIDFKYTSPVKLSFKDSYARYKEKRNQYYKNLEQTLKSNLEKRLEIIEDLKALINVEEDINVIYKAFKGLQDKWRKAGPVPRMHYNDLWRTYQHHIEIFYDFLDLNKELRDIDFRKNLEEKEKIIAKAEQLIGEEDVHKAFRELQMLHKVWKEDIGPVDREHREAIWQRFSGITRTIHQKRQEYFKNINEIHEQNLHKKQQIIRHIGEITANPGDTHGQWRKQIKEVEGLRKAFFEAGRVPYKSREKIWAAFKEAYRNFNRNKNAFYKKLKKEHLRNLKKKMELLNTAESLKDSEDWEKTTPVMKEIQAGWGKIGHVPKKYSDDIWFKFKDACNHYFNRLHAQRGEAEKKQYRSKARKKELLDTLMAFKPGEDATKDLETIKDIIAQWRELSQSTYRKRSIEEKFNKTLGALFTELGIDREQAELIKYENKLEYLAHKDALLEHEHSFVKRRIEELKAEIRQLENNLQFINAKDDNPVVKEVLNKINKHKEDLIVWEAKLKKLKTL